MRRRFGTGDGAMRLEEKVQAFFDTARAAFFPGWDSHSQWRIVVGSRNNSEGETGYCDSKHKRIYVNPFGVERMPDDGLLALIIHEICHDVATAHHTERWIRRMEMAAQAGDKLGQLDLARKIRASAYAEIPLDKPWAKKWCKRLYPSRHHVNHGDLAHGRNGCCVEGGPGGAEADLAADCDSGESDVG